MRAAIIALCLLVFLPAPLLADEWDDLAQYTKDGYIAALTRELYDEALGYLLRKDRAAFEQMYRAGQVIMLKPGLKCWIDEAPFLSGVVRLRFHGTRIKLWTSSQAIHRNP